MYGQTLGEKRNNEQIVSWVVRDHLSISNFLSHGWEGKKKHSRGYFSISLQTKLYGLKLFSWHWLSGHLTSLGFESLAFTFHFRSPCQGCDGRWIFCRLYSPIDDRFKDNATNTMTHVRSISIYLFLDYARDYYHRHVSLKVPNIEFDFDVWFLTLMHWYTRTKHQWVLIMACKWDVRFSIYVLGTVCGQHIHRSRSRRSVLSLFGVHKVFSHQFCLIEKRVT